MEEKKEKERQAYEQYLKEKEQVEKVMQTLIDSEMKELSMRETQKKKAFEDMQVQLEIKQQKKR